MEGGRYFNVDNRQVMHAGMPGAGSRVIRAMICNPIQMNYSSDQSGIIEPIESKNESMGFYAESGAVHLKSQ